MKYADQRFEGVEVVLDDNEFVNCTFHDVTFVLSGKAVDMKNCNLNQFRFILDGDLGRGLDTLHQLFGTKGMLEIVRGFAEPGERTVQLD